MHARIVGLNSWRLPGCDARCWPRRHDPEAHEEHGYQRAKAEGVEKPATTIVTGPMVIDLKKKTVAVDGVYCSLSSLEWRVLAHLAKRPDALCSSREISLGVWPELRWSKKSSHHLQVTLNRLRGKLGSAARLIETEVGRGRRLVMEDAP